MTTMRLVGFAHHKPKLIDNVMLGTDRAVAVFAGRHRRQVARYCEPVACDVASRLELYDVYAELDKLQAIPRRYRASA